MDKKGCGSQQPSSGVISYSTVVLFLRDPGKDFPGGLVVESELPVQGVQVQHPVKELTCHGHGQKRKKETLGREIRGN